MKREQMFGSEPTATMSHVPGTDTLYFDAKPREVNGNDCGPDDHSCCLYDRRDGSTSALGGDWEYDLCPNHTRWYRGAS